MLWKDQSQIETQVARSLADVQARHAADVSASLRRTGAITPELWARIERETMEAMQPGLSRAYGHAALQLGKRLGVSASKDAATEAAAQWAAEYLLQVVPGFTSKLQDSIGSLELDTQATPAEHAAAVATVFSDARAKRLATTETTRAAVEGEGPVAKLFNRGAKTPVLPVWRTSEDGLTCPICFPLNDSLPSSDWAARVGLTTAEWQGYADASGVLVAAWDLTVAPDGPPAHPNCRCQLEWTEAPELPEFTGEKYLSATA